MELMQQPDGSEPAQDSEEYRIAVLSALSSTLAGKRRDAVSAKGACGIEQEFIADEEFYQGYDDANRNEFVNSMSKPLASGGIVPEPSAKPSGSTVFPNITQPYVDAAAARVGDMLLPTDDRNFVIEATPIPDMFEGLDEYIKKAQPQPAAAPVAQPGGMQDSAALGIAGAPGAPQPMTPATPEQQVQMPDGAVMAITQAKAKFDAIKEEAARKAGLAQTQVDDWLTECQYHAELRKVIDDSAKLGSGVIKGPVPVKRVARQWRKNESGVLEMVMVEEIKPASFRVDPFDLFPDPACGESIHNGSYIFERDRLTGKKLEDMVGVPGYLESQIRLCLKEGPARQQEADPRNLFNVSFSNKEQYEIWYYHGSITVAELQAAGCDCGAAEQEDSFPAMLTMVNDRVIKAALNPLDNGEFPYDVIPWKRRPGMPWGMGVARQMRTPQRIVVAATRNLMDNAGLAAGPLITLRRGVEPEDGIMEIVPLKIFIENEELGGNPGSGVPLTATVIPMLQVELMAIIQFGMKMAEDVTGLPMLLQGQQGAAPDTVGGMQILNNNANSVLRRIARLFDSSITEPHIRRYYTWLMEYCENDDAKGDFQINARGSSALVERDIQSQELVQIVQMCLNPAYGKNPKKAMTEYLKSRRFDPAAFDYTEDEQAKMDQQQAPEDPRITAAKLTIASNEKIAGVRQQSDQAKLQAQQQFDADQAERDRQLDIALAQMDQELETRKQNGAESMSLSDVKAMLAATVLKLNTQKELSRQSGALDLHKHMNPAPQVIAPPSEPAGRAPAGAAFQA